MIRRSCGYWGAFSIVIGLVIAGCSREPQIAKTNVRLIEELRTAIGAKRTDWLKSTEQQIESARKAGKLSDGEYAAIEPIVADGNQSRWNEANDRLAKLIHGQ